jgi:hypothetical protein
MDVTELLHQALACEQRAGSAKSGDDRAILLMMADAWRRLARQREDLQLTGTDAQVPRAPRQTRGKPRQASQTRHGRSRSRSKSAAKRPGRKSR